MKEQVFLMEFFTLLSGGALIDDLLGGSMPLMDVFLTMIGLDLLTGYGKALKSHTWVSSINLYGLLTKFITFSTIICAAALDKVAPIVGIILPINVALIWTVLLIIYEIGSILENAHAFGLKISWLQKWLRVFEAKTTDAPDKEDQENNIQ